MDLKAKFDAKEYLVKECELLSKEITHCEERLNRIGIDVTTENYLKSKLIELNLLLQDNLNHSFNLR